MPGARWVRAERENSSAAFKVTGSLMPNSSNQGELEFQFSLPVLTKRWKPTNTFAHNIQQKRNKGVSNYSFSKD